jgi:hypothetical protein
VIVHGAARHALLLAPIQGKAEALRRCQ